MKSIIRFLCVSVSLFSLFICSLPAQNLVPNPGFESFNNCPTSSCQWFFADNWDNANGFQGCNNGNSGSPDYFNVCGSGFFSVPNTLNGEVTPLSGNAIMGLATWLGFSSDFREYLHVPLTSSLQAGNNYTLSFAYTNGDFDPTLSYGGYGTELGVHFSVGALTQTGTNPIILSPSYETVGAVFSNTWQTVTYTFTATNNATHLTIGNFRDDNAATIQQFAPPSSGFGYAYYYFDDISLTEDFPLPVNWLNFELTQEAQEAVLHWETPPARENLQFLIERSADAREFEVIGESWAEIGQSRFTFRDQAIHPTEIYYRLKAQNLDGEISYSTILQLDVVVEQNPDWYYDPQSQHLKLRTSPDGAQAVQVSVFDLSGRKLAQEQVHTDELALSLPPGIYLVVSQQGHLFKRQKILISP